MSIFYRKYKNMNTASKAYGKWFGRAVTMGKTVTLEDLAEQYADAEFKPEFITVDSRHAFYFMKAFCEAVGITLQIAYPLEEMEDLFDNMYDDMFNPVSMYQQFEEYAQKHPEARKQLDKLLKDNNKGELDAEELYDLFSRVMDDSSKE